MMGKIHTHIHTRTLHTLDEHSNRRKPQCIAENNIQLNAVVLVCWTNADMYIFVTTIMTTSLTFSTIYDSGLFSARCFFHIVIADANG